MNQAGRDALRAAALAGVRQIIGQIRDGRGGFCGLGVLNDAVPSRDFRFRQMYDLGRRASCPLGCAGEWTEWRLIAHLNDRHKLDFLGISEKMPVSPEDE